MKTIQEYLSGNHDEELRVLVAEARGWKIMPVLENQKQYGWPDGKKDDSDIPRILPKFPTSRDACRELLADLTEEEGRDFVARLSELLNEISEVWRYEDRVVFILLRATARQICVAYLIVKGVLK